MLRRNPLVPEVAVDLEHLLEPADRQPLQIQLGRDPQVEIHVERVVMRDERPRERAAGDRLHHRRLDLEVAARGHELADRRDDAAARLEDAARVGIDDEIEIALPVADLDVGQAVPLLRQRQQALRQEVQPRRPDRELVGLRAEQPALDADPVAEIEQLEDLEIERRQRVLPDVDLDLRAAVGQHEEVRLAERADRENAAARDGLDALGLELVVRPLAVRPPRARQSCARRVEPARVDLDAELRELLRGSPAAAESVLLGRTCSVDFSSSRTTSDVRLRVRYFRCSFGSASIFFRIAVQHPVDELHRRPRC